MPLTNRICGQLYVTSLLLAGAVLLFAPLHAAYTVRTPVLATLPGGEVRFRAPGRRVLEVGEEISCFASTAAGPFPWGRCA